MVMKSLFSKPAVVDPCDWPFLRVHMPVQPSHQEWRKGLEEIHALREEKGERYCMFVDLRDFKGMTPELHRILAEHMERTAASAQRHVIGVAFVVSTSVGWVVTQAILLARRPPYPTRVFRSKSEAELWLHELNRCDADHKERKKVLSPSSRASGAWILQVDPLDRDEPQNLVDQMRGLGYPVQVEALYRGERKWFRVLIGRFDDPVQAQALQDRLQRDGHGVVVGYDPAA